MFQAAQKKMVNVHISVQKEGSWRKIFS